MNLEEFNVCAREEVPTTTREQLHMDIFFGFGETFLASHAQTAY